jgi:hypothetical protein
MKCQQPCRGKPDTHNMYTSHAGPHMPLICFLRTVPICGNLSLAINNVGRILLLLRKRASDTIPSTPADQSIGLPPGFSPNTTNEVVMKAKHMLTTDYIDLLKGGNSLTDTGGGYNLGDVILPHHTPRPSQLIIPTFHLSALPGLRLTIQPLPKKQRGNKP